MKLDQLTPGEDLGNTIQRSQPLRGEIMSTPLLPARRAADISPTFDMEDLIVLDLEAPVIRTIPAVPPVPREEDTSMPMPTTAKPKKRKSKAKRDVIDDIFG